MSTIPILDYKLLHIVSSKKNDKYVKLKELLKNEKIINNLKNNKINVVENLITDNNIFNINLYNIDMRLVQTFDDINEQIIQEIINITDTLSKPKQMSQTGGFRNYKEKYYKYKQKYNNIKNVITKFYFI